MNNATFGIMHSNTNHGMRFLAVDGTWTFDKDAAASFSSHKAAVAHIAVIGMIASVNYDTLGRNAFATRL